MRKKILLKIFNPPNYIEYIGLFFIISSLFYLIILDGFSSPIAYILYLFMTYFFIIIWIKIYNLIKKKTNYIIEHNKYLKIYKNNAQLRHQITLFTSLGLNIIYVIFKLISGIYYHSIWLITFAFYYFLLVILRLSLVKTELNARTTLKEEYLIYRKSGILLLFMNVILTVIILVIVNQNITITYPVYIAITIACYTFYLLISNIINLNKYRKYQSPIMTSAKAINLITSIISFVSLEVVMLSTFNKENGNFNKIMIMATGGGISILIVIISLYMIIKATEWLNNHSE